METGKSNESTEFPALQMQCSAKIKITTSGQIHTGEAVTNPTQPRAHATALHRSSWSGLLTGIGSSP